MVTERQRSMVYSIQTQATGRQASDPCGFVAPALRRAGGSRWSGIRLIPLLMAYAGFLAAASAEPGPADLAAQQSISASPAVLGENVLYTIQVTNRGPFTASQVVVSNRLPANVTLQGFQQGGCSLSMGVVVCNLPNMEPGDLVTLGVIVKVQSLDRLTNGVQVRAMQGDPMPANNTAVLQTRVIPPFPVVVTPLQSTSVAPGGDVSLTVDAEGALPLIYRWRLNGENIPGAHGPTYSINNAKASDGGNYSVVIANAAGLAVSGPVELVVTLPLTAPGDNFANRLVLMSDQVSVAGSNVGATRESSEPDHAGSTGRRSVWYSWTAPNNGIATIDTRGSSFDTLLAVYRGTKVNGLVEVASDDDRGGFHTSFLRFNAMAGTTYGIAVDGFANYSGRFVLNTSFAPGPQLPEITMQPKSVTVRPGMTAAFGVGAMGMGLTYQWYHNGVPLAGQTGPILMVPNAQKPMVGHYEVRVVNAMGRMVRSRTVVLELGPASGVRSQDKLAAILFGPPDDPIPAPAPPASMESLRTASFTPVAAGLDTFFSVSAGTIDSQVFDNYGATTDAGERDPCSHITTNSVWFQFVPLADGCFTFSSAESDIPTLLAVYEGVELLDCSTNGDPVVVSATAGATYSVQLDGLDGKSGIMELSWQLDSTPVNALPTRTVYVLEGATATLTVRSTNSVAEPTLQWRFEGEPIVGAIDSNLELASVSDANAGEYDVVMNLDNGVCSLSSTNAVASVRAVAGPIGVVAKMIHETGRPETHVNTLSDTPAVIDASTNLVDWTAIVTNMSPRQVWECVDNEIPSSQHVEADFAAYPQRYFRAREYGP